MLVVYNVLQVALLVILSPLLLVVVLVKAKYRSRILKRLGLGIKQSAAGLRKDGPRIWVHALSVGEVASAKPLVGALREKINDAVIIFSASTNSGEKFARQTLPDVVDLVVPFPLDILPSVHQVIGSLNPDLFILVETDFWPNFVHALKRRKIPALLVNGRFSPASFNLYKKMAILFLPLFNAFDLLCMQTEADVKKLTELGVDWRRVRALGNLKYDSAIPTISADISITPEKKQQHLSPFGIPPAKRIWLAGSTHRGEEEILLAAYKRLKHTFPDLFLIVAPRNIERGHEINTMATNADFKVFLRSGTIDPGADILILDTLGELAGLYPHVDVSFIGGSLVAEGGHNPLEAVVGSCPVFFGPHMEDFAEIAQDLLAAGAAIEVCGADDICQCMAKILTDQVQRRQMIDQGLQLVGKNQGVTERHLAAIEKILQEEGRA